MFLRLPKAGAWFNALGLAIATALLSSGINFFVRYTRLLELLPVQWDLLLVCFLMLSPIWGVAYIHHAINILTERFIPDAELPGSDRTVGRVPMLVSWWEGLYAWLTLNVATIMCMGIGGLFIPLDNRYHNVVTFILHIFSMLAEPNKFKYALSGPFILWIICAAYLYEFEGEVQRYFVQKGRE